MQTTKQHTATSYQTKKTGLPHYEAVRSLNDKIKSLEELHCIMAHDLRGPVRNIMQLTDVLKELNANETGKQPEYVLDCINLIESAGKQLLSSLDTLLKRATIGLDDNIVHDDCEVAEIISGVYVQLNGDIAGKHACIVQNLVLEHISCPKSYLTSIIYNLLSNSLKYSSSERPTEITITTKLIFGLPALIVKDNGIGIDLGQYKNKIFKLNEYFHEGYDSKGVGLYLTRTQVESIGGTITVESTPGKGSTFTVYFPTATSF